jgi:hypothetical protein
LSESIFFRFMRFIITVVFLVSVVIVGHSQTNDWSKRIVSKVKHPIASLLSPCASDVNVLMIDKKRFEHVRGVKKFYLRVPQSNAILFVVDEKNYSMTYHVFDMETDEDIAIHARSSAFGRTIGFTKTHETIERTAGGKLVLCNFDDDAKSTLPSLANLHSVKSLYYLDITNKAVIAEKTIYLDKAGKVVEERNASPPF